MNLANYSFPIEEWPVAADHGKTGPSVFDKPLPGLYKAIVRAEANETIAMVGESCKIVENEELVKKLMYELFQRKIH